MFPITRREFGGALVILGTRTANLFGATGLDEILRTGMQKRNIPAVTAMVATADKTTYTGAFGIRDMTSKMAVAPDSIFAIASMTKAITSAAAMQLVEQGKIKLDEPVANHLPELGKLELLQGFDSAGRAILGKPTKPVLLRHILTHTSGFAYDTWSQEMMQWEKSTGVPPTNAAIAPVTPLIFEPGTRWQYGTSVDWVGRLVEAVSGLTLEQYFQRNILEPLGMKDTSFILAPEKFDRYVSSYTRQKDRSLKEDPRTQPQPPKAFNGGGGLFSTAPDYIRFTQMILKRGVGGKERILQAKTVDMMASNQIGGLGAGKLKTQRPEISSDVDFHPGVTDKFTYGFLMNTTAYDGGRSAGSLAWAGVRNTFYWIDPKRGVCAVIMMHFLPFVDKDAVALLGEFERGVYATLPRGV